MSRTTFLPYERAQRHPITCDKPAVDFFSGALLGNGGLGAVVTTRPDAVVVHFGHNNVWDGRVAEDHQGAIGTFQEIFERVRQIPTEYATLEEDPWYRAYCDTPTMIRSLFVRVPSFGILSDAYSITLAPSCLPPCPFLGKG